MEVRAQLKKLGIPARKARLVVALIRGMQAAKALDLLHHQPQKTAKPLRKLLQAALAGWQHKYPDNPLDHKQLRISQIYADSAQMLKRIQPAPQGRAHRIRKRSCHITLTLAPYAKAL